MAKNYVESGNTMDVTLSVEVKSGDPIIVGNQVVIALVDGASGENITAKTVGVWSLPKVAGEIVQGAQVYLDTDGKITTTATDNVLAGYANELAGASDGIANICIG